MKYRFNILLILFGLIAVTSGFGQSEMPEAVPSTDNFPKKAILKFSPFHFFDNSLQLGIEAFLGDNRRKSIVLLPVLYYQDSKTKTEKGGAFEIQYRIYPKGFLQYKQAAFKRARGIYLAPSITAGYSEIDIFTQDYNNVIFTTEYFKSDHYTCQWIMPSLAFGFQFTLWEMAYLDFNIGGGLKINDVKHDQFAAPSGNGNIYYNYNDDPSPFERYYKGLIPRVGVTLGFGL